MTAPDAKVFDLGSCRDLLGKLERELVRLEYSRDRSDRADHAANFAVWAWQLTEWVYAEIAARRPLRARLANTLGVAEDAFDLAMFEGYIQGPQGSPGLACCRAIARATRPIASDHDGPAGDRMATAGTVILLGPAAFGRRTGTELTAWRAPHWVVKAVDGEPMPDIELFGDVLQFWTDFIHANHIA